MTKTAINPDSLAPPTGFARLPNRAVVELPPFVRPFFYYILHL